MSNTPMTQERLDDISSRADAAERGPWEVMNAGDNETATFIDGPDGEVLIHDARGHGHMSEDYVWVTDANAEFIAHARTDIPALLAEVAWWREETLKAQRDAEFYRTESVAARKMLGRSHGREDKWHARAEAGTHVVVTDQMVDASARAYYEFCAPGTDDAMVPRWDRLVETSPQVAQVYRDAIRRALEAAHGAV